MSILVEPPRWSDSELETARLDGIADFVEDRGREGIEPYRIAFATGLSLGERLFELTGDLASLASGDAFATHPELLEIGRYLAGPPISADDLDTLAGISVSGRRRLEPETAKRAAGVIVACLDPERFPWIAANRPRLPTRNERVSALRWTAGLRAVQLVQTQRRRLQSGRQQQIVADLLRSLGFVRATTRGISVVGELERGQFMSETNVVGAKCDVPVGLRDGRLLLLECKVSNSTINSVKRLNRETVGKAGTWREKFGERAVTAAVLAGVFKQANLRAAQGAGVTIFWERDLKPLADFLVAAV